MKYKETLKLVNHKMKKIGNLGVKKENPKISRPLK